MKKLILLLLVVFTLQSCDSIVNKKNNMLIIQSVENTQPSYSIDGGKYKYTFTNCAVQDIVLYSDSLYQVGDTLILTKKK